MGLLEKKVVKFPLFLYTLEHEHDIVPIKSGKATKQIDFEVYRVVPHIINDLEEFIEFTSKYKDFSKRVDHYCAEVFTDRSMAYEACNLKNVWVVLNIRSGLVENDEKNK